MSIASHPGAFGDDRVVVDDGDGSILLSCRHDKGWTPRRPKDLVHAAFPGTCIQWGDTQYEVIAAEPLGAGARYRLLPWDDSNAIRTIEAYDEASERLRAEKRAAEIQRRAKRTASLWLGLLLGHLPAATQEEMESELGIRASRLTLVSVIPLLIWGVTSFVFTIAQIGGATPPFPRPLLLPGLYFFAESLIRFGWAMATGRPMGSFPVVLVAELLRHARAPRRSARSEAAAPLIDPSIEARDAYHLREPYLALLPPERQLDLAARFGFDPIFWGKRTAWFILAGSLAGMASGFLRGGPTGWIAAAVAALLFTEQIARLRRLAGGLPAGSILGRLVEPMARRLGGVGD